MMEVIISDFGRTIKAATKSEKASDAHKEFTKFERTTRASNASKETTNSNQEFALNGTDALTRRKSWLVLRSSLRRR